MEDSPIGEGTDSREPMPEPDSQDLLSELPRRGAGQLLQQAVETEPETFLEHYRDVQLTDDRQAMVRGGHPHDRTVRSGIGDVAVPTRKVRDGTASGIRVHSALLPFYDCTARHWQSMRTIKPIKSLLTTLRHCAPPRPAAVSRRRPCRPPHSSPPGLPRSAGEGCGSDLRSRHPSKGRLFTMVSRSPTPTKKPAAAPPDPSAIHQN